MEREQFQYWIPKPALRGWRVAGLFLVNLATAIGLCSFAVLGFAFSQIGEVSAELRWWLILLGSISLAIGSEVGTFVTVVEIFRKYKMVSRRPVLARILVSVLAIARSLMVVKAALGKIVKKPSETAFTQAIKMIDTSLEKEQKGAVLWDWVGLIISALTSLSAVALAQVSILQLLGEGTAYEWLPVIQQWAPAALACFGVLDGYINHAEYGLFLASFDEQVRQWFKDKESARRDFEKQNGNDKRPKPQSVPTPTPTQTIIREVQAPTPPEPKPELYTCWCGKECPSDEVPDQWYDRHIRDTHWPEINAYDSPLSAHAALGGLYRNSLDNGHWLFPSIGDVIRWLKEIGEIEEVQSV